MLFLLLVSAALLVMVVPSEVGGPYPNRIDHILHKIPRYSLEQSPRPFSDHNKVAGLILAYNMAHVDPLMMYILPEYTNMCEAGWDPTVVIFTAMSLDHEWTERVRRLVSERNYCYRLGRSIDIRYDVHDKNISSALSAVHRQWIKRNLDEYDVFLYHEDDIVFQQRHLAAYLSETALLKERLPWTASYDYSIGFQRFRHIHREKDQLHHKWHENDFVEQDMLEEAPTFEQFCLAKENLDTNPFTAKPIGGAIEEEDKNEGESKSSKSLRGRNRKNKKQRRKLDDYELEYHNYTAADTREAPFFRQGDFSEFKNSQGITSFPYVRVVGNIHQGAFIITQEQVKVLDIKCGFTDHFSVSREYMSSFSLFDYAAGHCGLNKLLPAETMHSFFIHHFFNARWLSW